MLTSLPGSSNKFSTLMSPELSTFTPGKARSVVAGIQSATRQDVLVALLDDVSPTDSGTMRFVIVAQSAEGWCVALYAKRSSEAHVVYVNDRSSARTTPRWRRVNGASKSNAAANTKADTEANLNRRPASETAVRAILPRLERTIDPPTALAWDLVGLPSRHFATCPEEACIILLAG